MQLQTQQQHGRRKSSNMTKRPNLRDKDATCMCSLLRSLRMRSSLVAVGRSALDAGQVSMEASWGRAESSDIIPPARMDSWIRHDTESKASIPYNRMLSTHARFRLFLCS